MAESTRIIQTGCGKVRGKLDGSGRTICLGLPYAKAERFCPPQPVCWEGVLDCLAYRGTALQPDRLGEYPAGKEMRHENDMGAAGVCRIESGVRASGFYG